MYYDTKRFIRNRKLNLVVFYAGDTCVVAAVFGPTEVRISKELPHRGAVDVLYRPKVTGTSQLETPVMGRVKE